MASSIIVLPHLYGRPARIRASPRTTCHNQDFAVMTRHVGSADHGPTRAGHNGIAGRRCLALYGVEFWLLGLFIRCPIAQRPASLSRSGSVERCKQSDIGTHGHSIWLLERLRCPDRLLLDESDGRRYPKEHRIFFARQRRVAPCICTSTPAHVPSLLLFRQGMMAI